MLENVWISFGEIPCESLLGVKGLRIIHLFHLSILHPGCSSFFNTFHLLLIKLQALLTVPSSFLTIRVSVTTALCTRKSLEKKGSKGGHIYFEQYFTHYKSKRKNYKSHLNLPFCKFFVLWINFGHNHTSLLNPIPPSWQNYSQLSDKCFYLSLTPTVIIICMKHDLYPIFSILYDYIIVTCIKLVLITLMEIAER